jgi:hypothetical protein
MALPPNLLGVLHGNAAIAHTTHMQGKRANISSSNNLSRHTIVRQLDEPSPTEARSIDKILRLPKTGSTN